MGMELSIERSSWGFACNEIMVLSLFILTKRGAGGLFGGVHTL